MFAFAKQLVKSAEGIISLSEEPSARALSQGPQSGPLFGFRVIHVRQNSQASEAGIESLFDFIVGINGHDLLPQAVYDAPGDLSGGGESNMFVASTESAPVEPFVQEIVNCQGRSVSFQVWTAKGRVQRTVMLAIPQDASTTDNSLGLGLTLQWCSLEVADHVWHVLNVAANSPAEEAGLISHADYIVAAENGLLESGGEGLLARVVSRICANYYNQPPEQTQDQNPPEIELYVYNHDYDTLRPVSIRPNPNWGGSGLLGCGVGYGLLHRLPLVVGKYPAVTPGAAPGNGSRQGSAVQHRQAPGDTLFEVQEEEDAGNLITPVSLDQAAPHLLPPGAKPHRSRRHSHSTNKPDLSDYFAEEERKSKENDIQTNDQVDIASLPPPPKASKSEDT